MTRQKWCIVQHTLEEIKVALYKEMAARLFKYKDTIAKGNAYDQVRWERDIAIEQLNEIGCELGETMDHIKEALPKNANFHSEHKDSLHYDDKVFFDDFVLYNEKEDSHGLPKDKDLISKKFDFVDINICPHCIQKYQLFEETQTNLTDIEKLIAHEEEQLYLDLTCGVEGCLNQNTISGILPIQKCSINGIPLSNKKEEFSQNSIHISR